ncbi:DUF6756 family protein [Mucilaginibacter arboris]|uniref:Uncharacterized protein n=1 Tax=Mucilaginibacter arboris TaxID=2682090 RepID=A0A7K1T2I6_9SPHI|nr:DUF6756 family protein [Mucilaginibacter arboris]MVN23520.1 hypothetical protein [Mucilaginibacter arboris]
MQIRKNKNLLRKTWTNLRAEISKVIAEKQIVEADFRPLSIYENWEQIEEKVYQTFCNSINSKKRPVWLWTNFKLDTFSLSNLQNRPEVYLDKLVEKNEKIWYVVNETINECNKLWFYEGKIKSIQIVINETWFDELYLISKKYEWLICINHHDCIIATGNFMPDRLRKLELEKELK